MLELLEPQSDIVDGEGTPLPGRTWRCAVCGARVREGQPHRGEKPTPHSTLEALENA
jgi:hypothetical protein